MFDYKKKYLHTEPLKANYNRRHGTLVNARVLLVESKGICPVCKQLIQKEADPINYIGNIAHIYSRRDWYDKKDKLPQNMFPNKYHINNAEQLDNIENLILLCKNCHYEYD